MIRFLHGMELDIGTTGSVLVLENLQYSRVKSKSYRCTFKFRVIWIEFLQTSIAENLESIQELIAWYSSLVDMQKDYF